MKAEIIDRVRLTSVLDIDNVEMTKIILSIFEDIPKSLEQVRACYLAKDRGQISFVAHTLKGETASFGLVGLSKLFATLEEEAEDLSLNEIEDFLNQIGIINSASCREFNANHLQGSNK